MTERRFLVAAVAATVAVSSGVAVWILCSRVPAVTRIALVVVVAAYSCWIAYQESTPTDVL